MKIKTIFLFITIFLNIKGFEIRQGESFWDSCCDEYSSSINNSSEFISKKTVVGGLISLAFVYLGYKYYKTLKKATSLKERKALKEENRV